MYKIYVIAFSFKLKVVNTGISYFYKILVLQGSDDSARFNIVTDSENNMTMHKNDI